MQAGQEAAAKRDPNWALALDLVELQETGKLGMRSESSRRAQGIADSGLLGANTGGQSKPAPVSPQATFNRTNPPSPPPGMGMANLDHIDSAVAVLEMEVGFRDIDNTALRYLRDLTQHDSSKWSSKIVEHQAFMSKMDKTLIGIAGGVISMIDTTERTLANPNTVIDPAYRQAFEAKADTVRKFITTAGLR